MIPVPLLSNFCVCDSLRARFLFDPCPASASAHEIENDHTAAVASRLGASARHGSRLLERRVVKVQHKLWVVDLLEHARRLIKRREVDLLARSAHGA